MNLFLYQNSPKREKICHSSSLKDLIKSSTILNNYNNNDNNKILLFFKY
jgi:hypothetical protein